GEWEIIFSAFKNFLPLSMPPLISKVTTPPPCFICFFAIACCGCDGRKGYFTYSTSLDFSSHFANSKALPQCLSIRTASVSKLFESNHALNGDMDGPVWRAKNRISFINSFVPSTAPPITRPCPSINLVAECVTICAPHLAGFCKYGVAKQLSTFKMRLCFFA